MSLISLLIALAAERYLSSPAWQFNSHYSYYKSFFDRVSVVGKGNSSIAAMGLFVLLPVVSCYFLLSLVDDGLIHFLLSTLVLISCFGCVATRDCYKQYLMAAFRGEQTTCELHHAQLLQDKNLADIGFGQALIWLNYRYFIAIMIFFVLFGAPGALLYRLVCKINEGEQSKNQTDSDDTELAKEGGDEPADHTIDDNSVDTEAVSLFNQKFLFILDWLPVRIVAFGYMLVGHFSRAMPIWLESLFDVGKLPHSILVSVAEKSEDFMVEQDDCTAEPCLLVRLAKRTLLLCLAVIAILILTGVMN